MIVISTYNPETKRTTQDEELLTTLLAALVAHRDRCDRNKIVSQDEIDGIYWQDQTHNCDRLIGLVYPLLGLSLSDVLEMVKRRLDQ